MADCKYIIKLPSGEQFVLPAGFSTVEYTDQIGEEYAKESPDQLVEVLKRIVPKELSNANTLKAIISKTDNVNDMLVMLNDRIEELGEAANIDNAIYRYVIKGKNNANKLLKQLQKPINSKYFANFDVTGVINMTSIANEKNRVSMDNAVKAAYGFDDVLSTSLNTFMNAIVRNKKDSRGITENKDSMTLYGTNSPFIGKAWVTEDQVVVYEKDDNMSLFLGLFKRAALNMDPQKLASIITDLNKVVKAKKFGKIELPLDSDGNISIENISLEEFFNGVVKNNVIHESQFETLLELGEDKEMSSEINAIIKAVADTIDPEDKRLNAAIKNLFWSLNPGNYGKNKLQAQMQAQKYMETELMSEIDFKVSEAPIINAGMQDLTRMQIYAKSTTITDEENSLYEDFMKNVTLYKDIVAFPIGGDKTMYATPIEVEKQTKGTFVRGARIGKSGDLEYVFHLFDDAITYRKAEDPIDPYIEGEEVEKVTLENATALTSKDYISQDVIKRFVRKGDIVSNKVVVGVYPGYIRLKSSKKGIYEDNTFTNIHSFVSKRLKHELEVMEPADKRSLVPIKNSDDISEGDFIQLDKKDPTKTNQYLYKRVILADKKNVWYTIPNPKAKGEYMVISVPKAGLKGVKDVFGIITLNEVEQILKSETLSTFTDPRKAQEGDLVRLVEDKNYVYGKVLNNNKVYKVGLENRASREVVDISDLVDPTFYTERDITQPYSLFSIRANTNKIIADSEGTNPLLQRMYYVVPEGTDPKSIRNISENVFNIGSFRNEVDTSKGEEDFTDVILELTNQEPGTKLYAQFESSRSKRYVKHLPNMTEIKYFNNLTEEQKNDLEVLQKGVYFSTFEAGFIDYNIYRITDIEGDKITARLYKIKQGKVVTTEKVFDRKALLADSGTSAYNPVGKIAKLYMINGNKKMSPIMDAIKKTTNNVSDIKRAESIARKLQTVVSELPIEIEFVEGSGIFEYNQKARINTNDQGIVKLQVNKDIGREADVVHEFLHLFLTPLRYKNPEVYSILINSIVKEDLDVTAAEERFVEIVSERIVENGSVEEIFTGKTMLDFVNGLQTALGEIDEDYTKIEEDNPITLLNMPLSEIFGLTPDQANTSTLYDKSMLVTEPMMRQWMTENNIMLKCE